MAPTPITPLALLPAQVWFDYWRGMFPSVTEDKLRDFEATYRGGAEEKGDVLAAYEDAEGDMDAILDSVMCARPEDEERFIAIIHAGIKSKKVAPYQAFTGEDAAEGGGGEGAQCAHQRSATPSSRLLERAYVACAYHASLLSRPPHPRRPLRRCRGQGAQQARCLRRRALQARAL